MPSPARVLWPFARCSRNYTHTHTHTHTYTHTHTHTHTRTHTHTHLDTHTHTHTHIHRHKHVPQQEFCQTEPIVSRSETTSALIVAGFYELPNSMIKP